MAGLLGWQLAATLGASSYHVAKRVPASLTERLGMPLRLGGIRVGVQLERRTEGHAAVGGADVKDVAGVTVTGVAGGIDEANDMVEGGRLTPALCRQ